MKKTLTADRLVGNTEIAALAGVTPNAVAHWRIRYEDFPRPLTTLKAGSIYDRDEVVAWLNKTGRT